MEALPESRSHSLRHRHFPAFAVAGGRRVAPQTRRFLRLSRSPQPLLRRRLGKCASAPSHFASRIPMVTASGPMCLIFLVFSVHFHCLSLLKIGDFCSQIVERTIEMIISEKSASSNVICSGYDKVSVSC